MEFNNISLQNTEDNLAELETLCNQVCVIQNGKVIENTSINQIKQVAQTHYKLIVDSTENLNQYLNYPMEIKNKEELTISVSREQIPEVVKVLVKHDVKVYEVGQVQMSLEDAFLKRTGGNTID